jgi:Ca-activated chloride channel homolog
LLNDEDFKDDRVDAGELGSGHTVTALYEVVPVGIDREYLKKVDDLKDTDSTVINDFNEISI